MDEHDQYTATATTPDGRPRYVWEAVRFDRDDDRPSYARLIGHAIDRRRRWREQYDQAKQATRPPPGDVSATDPSSPEGTPPCPPA